MIIECLKRSVIVLLLSAVFSFAAQAQSDLNIKGNYQHIAINELQLPGISIFQSNLKLEALSYSPVQNSASNKLLFIANTLDITTHKIVDSDYLIHLGGFEKYSYMFNIQTSGNTNIGFDFGVTKQYSNFSALSPNLHLSFGTRVEQKLNSWLYFYTYGQFLSTPINQPNILDPITYMNPMFKQSEVGLGLKAKYKNLEADFGTRTIFDTQFQKSKPLNLMNSKINIGF